MNEQLTLEGTYTLHSETAKRNGGDYDFDWVCVIDAARFPRFVESRFRMEREHEVTKTKAGRAKSPWFSLEFVALKSRGNQIGVITDLMSSCVASGRDDLLYELVGELQLEIDSLKHNTGADRSKLREIREQVASGAVACFERGQGDQRSRATHPARDSSNGPYRPALQHSSQAHRRTVGEAVAGRAVPRADHGQHVIRATCSKKRA